MEGRLPEGMSSSVRNEEEEDVTNATYTEQKSYSITGAKDTKTGEGNRRTEVKVVHTLWPRV